MAGKPQGKIMTGTEMIEAGKRKRETSAIYKVKSMEATDEAIKQTVSKALAQIEMIDSGTRIDLDDISLVKEVSKEYIRACAESSSFPTMSGLALALGCSREAIYYWIRKKPTTDTAKWFMMCHDLFSDILSEGALRNNCNPIFAIFVQKSMYGLRDNTPTEKAEGYEDDDQHSTVSEIRKRYGELLAE